MEYITVRIGLVPGAIKEVTLNGDRTVRAALQTAELSGEGREARINGAPATLDSAVSDGDQILLLRQVKGN